MQGDPRYGMRDLREWVWLRVIPLAPRESSSLVPLERWYVGDLLRLVHTVCTGPV